MKRQCEETSKPNISMVTGNHVYQVLYDIDHSREVITTILESPPWYANPKPLPKTRVVLPHCVIHNEGPKRSAAAVFK